MILQLKNENIIIKKPYVPEDIVNTKVSYIFELGTNQYRPILYIGQDAYHGSNVIVNFDKYKDETLKLRVELVDNVDRVMRIYEGSFILYRTFSLGTRENIDVYKALIEAQEQIKLLEERGEVI